MNICIVLTISHYSPHPEECPFRNEQRGYRPKTEYGCNRVSQGQLIRIPKYFSDSFRHVEWKEFYGR